ncbi:MAG: hypothetical protein N3F04_02100 [Candidatus Nezhaarchaeota archaeon]|nr:hypothetical protein [Candidatus Nezhaarchaeota archaeon]MCX8141571.1 hypothetical protein [Candidatus Nezhaarchaeota archaeon]MDW8049838.1 hypothetical protein [Nitrososphaerota archaeon]
MGALRLLRHIKRMIPLRGNHWVRHWYTVSSIKGDFDQYLGCTYAPFEFDDIWGLGEVVFGVRDQVGFISECRIHVSKDTEVEVEYGCDDGARLFVYDMYGDLVYLRDDSWKVQPFTKYSASFKLRKGIYRFRLDFYEWTAYARVSFRVLKGDIKPIRI